ncbi:MAG: LysM peptidoglycan-binding domain-containing protein [Lachnospiraceae bacterium]|nr:LysM peptidoglycan-binding domain-containing protein [Lachnospiraceae bacterium]
MMTQRSAKVSYKGIYQDKAERRIRLNHERRVRELRLRMLLFFTALIAGGILAIVCNSSASDAKSSNEEMEYKYYCSYQIQYGDSLTSIAKNYISGSDQDIQEYIKEVMSINHMEEDDYLRAGDYLIIPYYSTAFII